MEFEKYMETNFPNLSLRPALFYSWDIGIRFELGVEWKIEYDFENSPYLKGVYKRAINLFKSLHLDDEEIFVVANVNDYGDKKVNIFYPFVRDKDVLYKLKHKVIPYVFPEDDEEGRYITHRFMLRCKTSDIRYVPLLKVICNQDMGIRPSIFHDIFFININRETIFHVYDDRGCDLLAKSAETIRDTYNIYNGWILDYDREEIDKVFR
ncbi:DUF3885 domain-containing protein [Peribacillus butanolivorans]|uniref:DUF3885 domain-containing protein n=1 Tax=Peribacillus butanolivorans TaxID=421767 RepID=UPI00207CE59C|nr:DUF3885 domain-containing protein [Peribacillus butanolivorans]MCO0601354.1 DUF3885 domain-containing protein [Peribacillus butanolivorans]